MLSMNIYRLCAKHFLHGKITLFFLLYLILSILFLLHNDKKGYTVMSCLQLNV